MCVCRPRPLLFVYYFNLCRQSYFASLIYNRGLYSTFPNVSIALRMFMCLMVSNIVPANVRSVEWRYGKEQSATTDGRFELLSVENDLHDNRPIHIYILFTFLTHLELQKAESICKTIAAINVFE